MDRPKPEYLEDYQRTCRIIIEGTEFEVPENNTFLRVLQYLEIEMGAFELSYKDFCWNNDCHNCKFRWFDPACGEGRESLGCLTKVHEGMRILQLPRPVARTAKPLGEAG